MRSRTFSFPILIIATVFAAPRLAAADAYKETDLPFQTAGLMVAKGGGYSETAKDGGVNGTCNGVSLTSLSLWAQEITLKSTAVTPECMIQTKDYGDLRVKMNTAAFSARLLVTQKQQEDFKKLAPKKR